VPERPPLTRDRIVAAAVELADEHGVAWLSMRKLAAHLGYEVMSLYNHVANKDDLLDGMVDLVAGDMAGPPADADWKRAARVTALSAHEVLLRHPWVAALWSNRWPGPNRWRHMEDLLRVLAAAGLPDDLADLGFHAITLHISGFTQQQLSYAAQQLSGDEMYARFAAEVTEAEYPHVVDHVRYHLEAERTHDEFAFVLDLILDGLDRFTT
jgi:AcrR family transcriptional regulator